MEELFAVIGLFFVPAVMIVLIVRYNSQERVKRYQLQADLYAKAIEKGQAVPTVPTDWFAAPSKKRNPLNTGIICMATGMGFSLAVWLTTVFLNQWIDEMIATLRSITAVGIIPFLIGVAYVIIHFIEKKKCTNENAQ